MHRIDNALSEESLPAPQDPGPNPDGFFQDTNPTEGGTPVSADWLNATQEEICNVITETGTTLNKTSQTQLLEAINALIKSTSNPFSNYALIQGHRATGEYGGNLVIGWNTRELNTAVVNHIDTLTVDDETGRVRLPAGTYRLRANVATYQVTSSNSNATQLEIRNYSNATTIGYGLCTSDGSGVGVPSPETICEFTIESGYEEIYLRQHAPSNITNGKGLPSSTGNPEVYEMIEIWKLA